MRSLWAYAHRIVPPQPPRRLGTIRTLMREETEAARSGARAWSGRLVLERRATHSHLHRFDRSKKFSTWIYTIASNMAKTELRGRDVGTVRSLLSRARSRFAQRIKPLLD